MHMIHDKKENETLPPHKQCESQIKKFEKKKWNGNFIRFYVCNTYLW